MVALAMVLVEQWQWWVRQQSNEKQQSTNKGSIKEGWWLARECQQPHNHNGGQTTNDKSVMQMMRAAMKRARVVRVMVTTMRVACNKEGEAMETRAMATKVLCNKGGHGDGGKNNGNKGGG
jgi:hypothetical protein